MIEFDFRADLNTEYHTSSMTLIFSSSRNYFGILDFLFKL